MRSAIIIIFIGLVYTMGILTTPVTSRAVKVLRYRGSENDDVLINSNAIPPEISEHLNNFFSQLTPDSLRTLLRIGQWADEVPYEFKADPDYSKTPIKGYEELYNEFLSSRGFNGSN